MSILRSLAQVHTSCAYVLSCRVRWNVETIWLHCVLLVVQAVLHNIFFYWHHVSSFPQCCHRAPLLLVHVLKENFVCCPSLEVGWFSHPFSNVIIRDSGLSQKVDPFGDHHWNGDFLSPCPCKLSPLLQMLSEACQWFRLVVELHNLYWFFLDWLCQSSCIPQRNDPLSTGMSFF